MNTNDPSVQTYRICFVCLGNIVRSPLAENLFRQIAEENGAGDMFQVDSAGTSSYHIGDPPDRRMRRVAAERGLVYSGSARQFTAADFSRFDLIVPMDVENRADLEYLAPKESDREKILLLRDFDPIAESDASVPDPYYGNLDGFHEAYDIIERSCRALFRAVLDGGVGPRDAGS